MLAARRVGEDEIDFACLGGLNRVKNHRARVRPRLRFHDLDADSVRPNFQLVHRRRPEGVPGRQKHGKSVPLQHMRDLRDCRGLARAVHANKHKQGWRTVVKFKSTGPNLLKSIGNRLLQPIFHRGRFGDLFIANRLS